MKNSRMQKTFKSSKGSLYAIRKTVWLAYYLGKIFCILKKYMKINREIYKQNRCKYQ